MIPNVKEIKVARDFRPGVYVDEFCGRQRTRSSGVSAGLSYRRDGGQETSCTLTSFREQKRERDACVRGRTFGGECSKPFPMSVGPGGGGFLQFIEEETVASVGGGGSSKGRGQLIRWGCDFRDEEHSHRRESSIDPF